MSHATALAARKFEDVVEDLSAHGIKPEDYIKIKELVSFSFPLARVIFVRRFGRRTIAAVLKQIDVWREFLEKQSLLTLDDRSNVDRLVSGVELLVWNALLDANLPQVGPWTVSWVLLPTGVDEDGRPEYLRPALKLTAIHRDSQEKREAIVPGEDYNTPLKWPAAWKHAFEKLGIWDLLDKGSVYRGLVSERQPKGWPLFTQFIVPALYEHLLPFYGKPGHYSQNRDKLATRKALFPNELLQVMLDILRLEHPDTFATTTDSQLKAVIQRYLDRKRHEGTMSAK
jgi:hypothetical protein